MNTFFGNQLGVGWGVCRTGMSIMQPGTIIRNKCCDPGLIFGSES